MLVADTLSSIKLNLECLRRYESMEHYKRLSLRIEVAVRMTLGEFVVVRICGGRAERS